MDVSIIIPYYKRLEEFRYAFSYNYEQFCAVKEVIIIIDEPITDLSVFSFLKVYPIHFVFLMNTEQHPWRNPAVVINKGIEIATSEKCLIMSPESILLPNAIRNLVEGCTDTTFSVGTVQFMSYTTFEKRVYDDALMKETLRTGVPRRERKLLGPVEFGSLCCTRANFGRVNRYNEEHSKEGWGGEDDAIRTKLEKAGITKRSVDAVIIHPETDEDFTQRLETRAPLHKKQRTDILYDTFIPVSIHGIPSGNLKERALAIPGVIAAEVVKELCPYYPIILLAPAYNEERNMKEYLDSVSRFVDGIILLDDGSTDSTWDLMEHPKLIMKCKKSRTGFDDLANRNLLLQLLGAVVDTGVDLGWFLWLDLDERVTANQTFLNHIKRGLSDPTMDADTISLPLFHMWNDTEYNTEYPYSEHGLQYKLRLIRHKKSEMPYTIKVNSRLHFALNPYKGKKANSLLQIKHLSYTTTEKRNHKFRLYTSLYDPDGIQKSYTHMINEDAKLSVYDDFMVARK